MINRRNITAIAAVMAGLIMLLFWLFPNLYHGPVRLIYIPNLIIAATIAHFFGHSRFPSDYIGWPTSVVYTMFYIGLFVISYAILLEFYLLQKVYRHLDRVKNKLTLDASDSDDALEEFGRAIVELEGRRRNHSVLLKRLDLPEGLSESNRLVAAHAVVHLDSKPPVKRLLKKLSSKITTDSNRTNATVLLAKLQRDARKMNSEPGFGTTSAST